MNRMNRILAIALLVLAGAACSGAGSDGSSGRASDGGSGGEPKAHAVTIRMFNYKPATVTVPMGATVTWSNEDEILHTATSGKPDAPTDTFDGTMDSAGATFSHTFARSGTYPFFCSRHNGMRGEIVVEE